MATKTISIDLVAYEKLTAAKLGPRDSFSQVIRRAKWDEVPKTCGALFCALGDMPAANDDIIRRLESAQQEDSPPDDPWA
jgi:hypothetical protein